MLASALIGLALLAPCGCAAPPSAAASQPLQASAQALAAAQGMPAAAKRRAEALTSLFENGTQVLQYGYAEALDDGRGWTAGRAGFCSGTHDMLDVVQRYTARVPANPLARYLPRLREIDQDPSQAASLKGLEDLDKAWAVAATDPAFRGVQDEVVDETYYRPAMAHAARLGVRSNLGKAILYDTIIQHGDGADLDGTGALEARTSDRAGGTPITGVDERRWLATFLPVRREDLAHAYAEETREEWAKSVTRVDALASVLAAGYLALDRPFHLQAGGYDEQIP